MKKQFWILIFCLCLLIPASASEKVDSGKMKEQITAELKAMKERKPQTKCPISGAPVTEGAGFTYLGYQIKTCCEKCAEKVKKDPLNAVLKIRQNNEEPALAKGVTHQTTCPIMGSPAKDTVYGIKNNILVKYCCPGCDAKFKNDPSGTVKAMLEKGQAPVLLTLTQSQCPVSGNPISKKIFIEHKGKKIYFCCEECKPEFKKNPEKFIQSLSDEGVVLENAG